MPGAHSIVALLSGRGGGDWPPVVAMAVGLHGGVRSGAARMLVFWAADEWRGPPWAGYGSPVTPS
jgi:hypothetical protein